MVVAFSEAANFGTLDTLANVGKTISANANKINHNPFMTGLAIGTTAGVLGTAKLLKTRKSADTTPLSRVANKVGKIYYTVGTSNTATDALVITKGKKVQWITDNNNKGIEGTVQSIEPELTNLMVTETPLTIA